MIARVLGSESPGPGIRFCSVWLLVLITVLGALGCGPPPARPARDVPSDGMDLVENVPDNYAEETDEKKSLSYEQLRNTFEGALSPSARAVLRHDPRLDHVAGLIAFPYVRHNEIPVSSLIQWYFWKHGCVDHFAGYATWGAAGAGANGDLDQKLTTYASTEIAGKEPLSYGIARFKSNDSPWWGQAVIFGRRPVQLQPLPKVYKPGQQINIELRLRDEYAEPRLYMDEPGGGVTEQTVPEVKPTDKEGSDVPPSSNPTYRISVAAPSKPGRYFIEITAREPLHLATDPNNPWRRSVLWVPIYVGIREPSSPDSFIRNPDPNPPPEQWLSEIVAGYDKARSALQLPPLQQHGQLTRFAQDRSIEAGDAPVDLPPDPKLSEKVLAAGLPPNRYYQTQGSFERLSEHIQLTLLRPASRFHLVSKTAPWIGIGIAPVTHDARGIEESAVVEYTVQPVETLDVSQTRKRVEDRLNALRSAGAGGSYAASADFTAAAQSFAESVCKGARAPENTEKAWEEVRKKVVDVGEGSSVYLSTYDLSEDSIDRMARKIESSADHVAIGVCQGDLTGMPQGTFAVILSYAARKKK